MGKYKFSYTAVSFMLNETIKIATIYREQKDWVEARSIVLDENIIQKTSLSTMKRMFSEFRLRISSLSADQLDLLIDGNYDEQVQVNLLSICKSYRLIEEFITEVLRSKFLIFDSLLMDMDYVSFVEEKEAIVPEFECLADSTKYKLKQVLFLILEETNLLSNGSNKHIMPIVVGENLKRIITNDNPRWLEVFLMSDSDIERTIEEVKNA